VWTIDELVERVRAALAAEYSGAGDGRIRDVPDRRAIRWYQTIGLVDRPLGMRGRTALYGPRHLQQLVAIKRRQAAGRSLSQIQGELNWVSPEALAELSRVPEGLLETDGLAPEDAADHRHMRFWARQSMAAEAPSPESALSLNGAPQPAAAPPAAAPPAAAQPATAQPATAQPATAQPATAQPATAQPATAHSSPAPPAEARMPAGRPVHGVALHGGAILLVPHPLSDRDRDDIAAAAAPLLDLLAARGLLDGSSA
jgi:DNA-binding transcriptional MerR regulator